MRKGGMAYVQCILRGWIVHCLHAAMSPVRLLESRGLNNISWQFASGVEKYPVYTLYKNILIYPISAFTFHELSTPSIEDDCKFFFFERNTCYNIFCVSAAAAWLKWSPSGLETTGILDGSVQPMTCQHWKNGRGFILDILNDLTIVCVYAWYSKSICVRMTRRMREAAASHTCECCVKLVIRNVREEECDKCC